MHADTDDNPDAGDDEEEVAANEDASNEDGTGGAGEEQGVEADGEAGDAGAEGEYEPDEGEEEEEDDAEEDVEEEPAKPERKKPEPYEVPKSGHFYLHDDRTEVKEKGEGEEEEPQRPKKKLWSDEPKWKHDKYVEVTPCLRLHVRMYQRSVNMHVSVWEGGTLQARSAIILLAAWRRKMLHYRN